MAQYTCPYCMTEHDMNDVEFRCLNSLGKCVTEPDIPYTLYEGGDPNRPKVMNKVFRPRTKGFKFINKMFMPVQEQCPQCKEISEFRLCPSCHNVLPPNIHENEDMIISIVGTRDSGKSHYIGVLIDELQRHICPKIFGAGFMETDKDVREHYVKTYYYPLYSLNQPLDLTNPNEKQKPLIYELQLGQGKKNYKTLTFIFYDTAGENYDDLMTMSTLNKYICKSAGIIFLVDPTQVEEVRDRMDEDKMKSASTISWDEIVTRTPDATVDRVAKLIRQSRGWGMNSKKAVDIPIAMTFSKLDSIMDLLPPGCAVAEPGSSIRDGAYNRGEMKVINDEISALLQDWGERRITTILESNFKNYAYFGVSALGQGPEKGGSGGARKIQKPRPHRVEDPFLWIMDQNHLL